VVNFDLGNSFRDLGPSNGACSRVGGWVPLPLRGSGVLPLEIFLRFLMPNPAFGGNLGQKIN